MMRRVVLTAAVAVVGTLASVSAAQAANGEFGDSCVGAQAAPFGGVFELGRKGAPLPVSSPNRGVLTKWVVRMPAVYPPGVPRRQSVSVVNAFGSDSAEILARGRLETLAPGVNEFETRLPISYREHLAIGSSEGSIVCEAAAAETVPPRSAGFGLPLPQSGKFIAVERIPVGVPVTGVVERDEDGDGYGDRSQDGCPESRFFHGPCPTVRFAPGFELEKRGLRVRVRVSREALVVVEGLRPELGASMGTRRTIPGHKLSSFRLEFTPVTRKLLNHLPRSQSLRFKLTARIARVHGRDGADQMYIKIPGRG